MENSIWYPIPECTQNPWAKSEKRMDSIYSIPRTIHSKKDNKVNEEGTKHFNVHVHVSCLLAGHIGFSFHCIARTAAPVAVTNKRNEWILEGFFFLFVFRIPFHYYSFDMFRPSSCSKRIYIMNWKPYISFWILDQCFVLLRSVVLVLVSYRGSDTCCRGISSKRRRCQE